LSAAKSDSCLEEVEALLASKALVVRGCAAFRAHAEESDRAPKRTCRVRAIGADDLAPQL
jgi:hypothetical protein